MAAGIYRLAYVRSLLLGGAEGNERVALLRQPDVQSACDGVQIVRTHGQPVPDGHRVAQVHCRVDVGEALALGDTGQQRLDGTHKLIGVDAQGSKRRSVGQDILRLLGLFSGEIDLALRHIPGQHFLQLRNVMGVVQPAHRHRAEAGVGQLIEKFL